MCTNFSIFLPDPRKFPKIFWSSRVLPHFSLCKLHNVFRRGLGKAGQLNRWKKKQRDKGEYCANRICVSDDKATESQLEEPKGNQSNIFGNYEKWLHVWTVTLPKRSCTNMLRAFPLSPGAVTHTNILPYPTRLISTASHSIDKIRGWLWMFLI